MFLGYQNNKEGVEFIAYASQTRDMFDQYIEVEEKDEHGEWVKVKKYLYPTTRVVETTEAVELIGGVYYVGQANIDAKKRADKEVEVHAQRKTLLEESDLWMLADRYAKLDTAKQTELTTYRQALRDVTSQSGYPFDVIWPTKPSWFDDHDNAQNLSAQILDD